MKFTLTIPFITTVVLGCENCYGPRDDSVHVRNVRRMQPESQNAPVGPRAPLEWGQLNFLQTTDTHGWLEGHLKEQNYGADWGDFAAFTRHMKHKADSLGVDLLLVDTGDLHDGSGLSDSTKPNGLVTNPIWQTIDYDILTIGNHELYVADISYETFNGFAKVYGERYITSNVQIKDPETGTLEYIGNRYRYFTTKQGLRIMSFGVIFDFAANSNATKITKAKDLVKEEWFLKAVNYDSETPIDLFVVIGHNPIRGKISTFGPIYDTIHSLRPDIPIQFFGGHTHIRDFIVYDQVSTGLESGRYCETLGWLSITGIQSPTFKGTNKPEGVPHPTQKAISIVNGTATAETSNSPPTSSSKPSNIVYSRRYLDWNRLTFDYHAVGSQDYTFDDYQGERITTEITAARKKLNLTSLYGCVPETYCVSCKPFGAEGNIYNLLSKALAATVINKQRAEIPRLIIINTGSIRFDLVKGPFTLDDRTIVSPFYATFQFIADVPYNIAKQVLPILNGGPIRKKRDLESRDFNLEPLTEVCPEGIVSVDHDYLKPHFGPMTRGLHRRQTTNRTPGYVTEDDFGTTGDDTPHNKLPEYPLPNNLQANASFPTDGSDPKAVDLVFLDFLTKGFVLPALQSLGANFTLNDVQDYLPSTFTTNSYLPEYAKLKWQAGLPNCRVGTGVGS
ncbi:hypothetical protein MMC22_008302 [Lobaria immixta]|nr:hypothetical protein [Lobaria immixta]